MSTTTNQLMEFRCNHCWQSNYVETTASGTKAPCSTCGEELLVPAASAERIERAAGVDLKEQAEKARTSEFDPVDEFMSDADAMRLVQAENSGPDSGSDFSGYPDATCMSRLLAAIIDVCAMCVAVVLGTLAAIGADNLGLMGPLTSSSGELDLVALMLIYFFPLIAIILQWNLIATRGQTIGKFLTCIRIVTTAGRLPGFIRGVVVRNWLRNLLSVIPFFSLLDILFILGASRRCLHDYMADTRVVQT